MPVAAPISSGEKRVLTFLSAASGDGASTAALNTAYALSQLYNGSTVLVDMDYQYGMVAKHIALAKPADEDELLAQKYVDDESKTITDLVSDATVAIGEKISIRRFARFETKDGGSCKKMLSLQRSQNKGRL